MKKVLGIFCHPDDEVLFGWPIFQSNEFEKYLIICCDDYSRKGSCRKNALQEVCKQENINLVELLSENNNFYSLPTRDPINLLIDAVNQIKKAINESINLIQPDYIFTHNPVGEYGHGSHRLLFELISQNDLVNNLIITDICQESNHRSHKEIPKFIKEIYYREELWPEEHRLNINFYNRCKAIYDKYNAWTWCYEPIKKCNLYLLKENV